MKTIFRMPDESEPGRSAAIRRRMVMGSKNPSDHILINRHSKGQLDLSSNARTPPPRDYAASYRPPHELNPGRDLLARGFTRRLAENSIRYLRWTRARWKF